MPHGAESARFFLRPADWKGKKGWQVYLSSLCYAIVAACLRLFMSSWNQAVIPFSNQDENAKASRSSLDLRLALAFVS
ncbi:MAG: hypothetical protein Q8R88_02790 [Desulfoprunum sp.]|nr:hypothetical protein [Desulfoprunum sp.]